LAVVDTGTWLVVGLGNPGSSYAGNRHNIGAMVVHELARRHASGPVTGRGAKRAAAPPSFKVHKARAYVCETRLATGAGGAPGPRAVIGVPSTYMNESGGPVRALATFFSVELDRLVVVHDELDIPAGEVRLKRGGGEGGHNGLRSISQSLGTRDYLRVRVGIGRPPGRMDPSDYVLHDFSGAERAELPFTLDTAADAVEALVAVGLLESQQRFHGARG